MRLYSFRSGHECLATLVVIVAATCVALTAPVTARAATYALTDIGTIGGLNSLGRDLNDAGQAVGWGSPASGPNHAFLYSNGTMQDLGTLPLGALPYGTSDAYGINASGQVTGYSLTSVPDAVGGGSHIVTRAFLYSSGSMLDLGTLGGANSRGLGINVAGQVTGWANTAGTGATRAFLYTNGSLLNLGTLGGSWSEGAGVNDSAQVTGWALTSTNLDHAFLYSAGVMQDLGSLIGPAGSSRGSAINNAGQVTGSSSAADGSSHAFIYSNGVMQDLGTLPSSGFNYSFGSDINDLGQVVGSSNDRPFLFSGGVMSDVNDLIDQSSPLAMYVTLTEAWAINDKSEILAGGIDSRTGNFRTFLLTSTPVPLPAAGWLLLSGLSGLGAVARRQRKRDAANHSPCTWPLARNGSTTRAISPSPRRWASAMISSERCSA